MTIFTVYVDLVIKNIIIYEKITVFSVVVVELDFYVRLI